MRIVIDMQGAQSGSRFRGIGRYTLSLAKAMLRNRGNHQIILVLSGLFPETLEALHQEFAGLLPPEDIRTWYAPGPTRENDPVNHWRREVAERMREAFLAALQPDIVLVSSLFEGFGDDAVGSVGLLDDSIPTAVILYDLIPLISPDNNFRNSGPHQEWYRRKIASLRRSHRLLAISESARQEALTALDFPSSAVVNISGACDASFKILPLPAEEKRRLWQKLGIQRPFLLYAGGADDRKNLDRLIMAFAQLPKPLRTQHQLVFAGKMPDSHVTAYRKTAKKANLSAHELVFTGYIDDDELLKLYNSCALFVFPSLHEGFGLPPLEAMACGAPVIGANATSLPEVIGLPEALFDPTSVDDMSTRIAQALGDEEFRKRLLEHGKTQYLKFSWDESARRALRVLEKAGHQRRGDLSPLVNFDRTAIFEKRHLKILVIKLDHLGDFILAIPALAKLRARYPHASIDIVVGSWNAPAAAQLGLFAHIFTYDFFKRKSSELPSVSAELLDALSERLGIYDIAIDLRRQPDSRFLLARVNADLKLGYETHDPGIDSQIDIKLQYFFDIPYEKTPLNNTSIASQMIRLVDALPHNENDFICLPQITVPSSRNAGSVAIFPKAGSEAREWATANFVELIRRLAQNPEIQQINLYFSSEREVLGFEACTEPKIRRHVGLDFANLSQSLAENHVCVANNSGGGHLASYLGVITIGLYSGHELPSEWAPQFNDSYVIHRGASCAPCHGATRSDCPNFLFCLSDITVSDVCTKVLEAISEHHEAQEGPTPSRPISSVQKSTDTIVANLIKTVAGLVPDCDATALREIAMTMAKNHPNYSMAQAARGIQPGIAIDHRSTSVGWRGFSGIEPHFRWTDGDAAAIHFDCPSGAPRHGSLVMLVDTLGEQRVVASLNGTKIFEAKQSGSGIMLKMKAQNFHEGRNVLGLKLPDARLPGNGDGRKLAIAVRSFKVELDDTH